MHIKILGRGCAKCANLERIAREAAAALGIDATVETITDDGAIAGYGVMRRPGLVVDGRLVVSGRVPTASVVKEMLAPPA